MFMTRELERGATRGDVSPSAKALPPRGMFQQGAGGGEGQWVWIGLGEGGKGAGGQGGSYGGEIQDRTCVSQQLLDQHRRRRKACFECGAGAAAWVAAQLPPCHAVARNKENSLPVSSCRFQGLHHSSLAATYQLLRQHLHSTSSITDFRFSI